MIEARVKGLPDLRAALNEVRIDLRKRIIRNSLAAGARVVRDEARRNTPILDASKPGSASALRRGVRKPGTVRDAIVVRTSKAARRAGDIGVFVNVRPAKGAVYRTVTEKLFGSKGRARYQVKASKRGANSPNDPFYWRFLEFKTSKRGSGIGFLSRAAGKLGDALNVFIARVRPEIEKYNGRVR